MDKYVFRDTDITGFEEYDIVGDDYKTLIDTCCKYCTVMSLYITDSKLNHLDELEKFRIPKNENIKFIYEHYGGNPAYWASVKYYRVCPELKELLLKISDSIFKWLNGWGYKNPDDPTFYRKDGSVFFTSTIHDGECILMPKENEDVTGILSNKNWKVYMPIKFEFPLG